MPAVAALTLLGVTIFVAVLAGYLIYIAFILLHVVRTLEVILGAVGAVSVESEPIGPVAGAINADLDASLRALQGALAAGANGEQQSVGVGVS